MTKAARAAPAKTARMNSPFMSFRPKREPRSACDATGGVLGNPIDLVKGGLSEGSAKQTQGTRQRFLTKRPARTVHKASAPGNIRPLTPQYLGSRSPAPRLWLFEPQRNPDILICLTWGSKMGVFSRSSRTPTDSDGHFCSPKQRSARNCFSRYLAPADWSNCRE
jgi:hypothetical protein